MSQEQREILKMVADGKISVEEAERLLDALETGQRKGESAGSARRQQGVQDALNSVRDAVAGIGPMVSRIVGEITTEIQKDRNFPGENDAEELPELPYEGNRFPVAQGTKLYIRSDKEGGPSGGDLVLESIEGDHCQFEAEGARNLRVLRSSSGPVIRWSGGPLKVQIPATAHEVFAYTLGGELKAAPLACPSQLKTVGGEIVVGQPAQPCVVKTMGGNIRFRLGTSGYESAKLRAMGGNIKIEVDHGVPRTDATVVCVGGSLIVAEEFGEVKKGVNLGLQKTRLDLGEGEPESALNAKALGGNIEIRRLNDE